MPSTVPLTRQGSWNVGYLPEPSFSRVRVSPVCGFSIMTDAIFSSRVYRDVHYHHVGCRVHRCDFPVHAVNQGSWRAASFDKLVDPHIAEVGGARTDHVVKSRYH